MPFGDKIRVIQSGGRRLKIFIDFWNVVISARQQTETFEIELNWDALAEQLISETREGFSDETQGALAGCYIFGSYAKSNAEETKFINRTLDRYAWRPGLFFTFAERVKKQTTLICQQCGNQHSHTGESGVDVILTVEMIKHAAMHQHEYLTLVSSDRDFIPLLSYLKDQGERVLHVATQDPNREMRSLTWKQVGLRERYSHLCRIESGDKYIIFTTPSLVELTREAETILTEQRRRYEVIDLTDGIALPDKDLKFVLSNQNLFFRRKEATNNNQLLSYNKLYESIGHFRTALRVGDVIGDRLPYVMHSGSLYACGGDQNSRWIVSSNNEMMEPWRNRPLPGARHEPG
jgi:uncharacterized LabA/DUF88 family protein